MLRLMHPLKDFKLAARDGDIGRVKDFLFDDKHSTVRYMVVDTKRWLPGRQVLISPVSLGKPDWDNCTFSVNLSKKEVEQQPDLDEDAPVTRQHEQKWFDTYAYPYYWAGAFAWGYGVSPSALVDVDKVNEEVAEKARSNEGDPHLRSLEQIRPYKIDAVDGTIGHVEDALMDDETWTIRYLIIDTRKWLPSPKVILAFDWFADFDWAAETISCNLTQEEIKSSPEFDPNEVIDRTFEKSLYDYYGKPAYWVKNE